MYLLVIVVLYIDLQGWGCCSKIVTRYILCINDILLHILLPEKGNELHLTHYSILRITFVRYKL